MNTINAQRPICQLIFAILILSKTAVFGGCPHLESLGSTSTSTTTTTSRDLEDPHNLRPALRKLAQGKRRTRSPKLGHGPNRPPSRYQPTHSSSPVHGTNPMHPTPTSTIYLSQSDFDNGTYRITQSAHYILTEDISFAPNSVNNPSYARSKVLECCKPRVDQFESNGGDYPDFPYSLGFFAALTVEAHGVVIDLAGYIIEQSKEHALMQRFFSVIELASTPFIPGQGPANFGEQISSGSFVLIKNGTIGRSAHHGIHGNGNSDVKIQDVTFNDFEVAAVALNGVEGLLVERCSARSRSDVPVMGRFSSGLFVHRYVKVLEQEGVSTVLTVKGVKKTATDIRRELEDAIVNVYEDIVINEKMFIDKAIHPTEYALYHNKKGVVDGNAYGFLTNSLGVAVNGFPWVQDDNDNSHHNRHKKFSHASGFPWAKVDNEKNQHSKKVVFHSVTIHDLQASITEVVSLMRSDNGKPVTDSLGSVLQLRNVHPDYATKPVTLSSLDDTKAEYTGNVVTNAQLFAAKCINKNEIPISTHLPTSNNQINEDIIVWAEAAGTNKPERFLSSLLSKLSLNPEDNGYYCNGDTMFHVNKGIVGFKIDNTDDAELKQCQVKNMVNYGSSGSTICGKYHRSHPSATLVGYGGATVRGFSFAGSRNVLVKNSSTSNLISESGNTVGYDVLTDSEGIKLESCTADRLQALGEDISGLTPTSSCGLRFSEASKYSEIDKYCFEAPYSLSGKMVKIMDYGKTNDVVDELCLEA